MTDPRNDLRQIARAALDSVDPGAIIGSCLRIDGERLSVNAPGGALSLTWARIPGFRHRVWKGLPAHGAGSQGLLGARIDEGIIVVKPGPVQRDPGRIRVLTGVTPPDENSLRAAAEIAALADGADEGTWASP